MLTARIFLSLSRRRCLALDLCAIQVVTSRQGLQDREIFRNKALNANDWFNNSRKRLFRSFDDTVDANNDKRPVDKQYDFGTNLRGPTEVKVSLCRHAHANQILATATLNGLQFTGQATATTITSGSILDELDENDETEPNRVAPVAHSLTLTCGNALNYTFPNTSVTVLRIPLKK